VLLELTVAEQRFNSVMEVIRDGLTVIEVAERYGVSRQAVHGWLRRYATGGLDALADRSHRPHRCPHQMPAAVEARLCELRRRHPQLGRRRHDAINRFHCSHLLLLATVADVVDNPDEEAAGLASLPSRAHVLTLPADRSPGRDSTQSLSQGATGWASVRGVRRRRRAIP
jgi:transposase-like protein